MDTPKMYNLTDITGRNAQLERSDIVGTIQIRRAVSKKLMWAALPTLISLMISGPLMGVYSILVGSAVLGVAYAAQAVSPRGQTDSYARAMLAKYRDKPGVVYMSGVPVTFDQPKIVRLEHAATMSPRVDVIQQDFRFRSATR